MSDPLGYTVAWVCSDTTECVVAREFLDEEHDSPINSSPSDKIIYTLGRIWEHNVVIATLARRFWGIYSTTRVVLDLQKTFPNIRICLMVGIGGGLPSQSHDIRLGDVVVSFSSNSQSSHVQYDPFETASGSLIQSSLCTSSPPVFLSTAVTQLMIEYEKAGNSLKSKVHRVLEKWPQPPKKYQRPGPVYDRLYQSHVVHVNDDETCNSCGDDLSHLVVRNSRLEIDAPAIHYGLIGSSNLIIRDASYRDKISAETGILCYILDTPDWVFHFPCLLVRGISDYCDSHKNRVWWGYASIVAAACAKDLLKHINPRQLEQEAKIGDILLNGDASVPRVGRQSSGLEVEDGTESHVEAESEYGAESEDVDKSEDEVKSTIIYETDLESILSEGSHLSSQSSQSQLGSILILEFANLLLSDNDLGRLYPKAISKLGLAKFQRNFTRFLKRYGKDLTNEASNERQRQAGQFVCQVARRTAAQVGKTLGQGGDKLPVEQLPLLSGSSLAVVDAWLNSHEQHDPNLGREAFVDDSESSESEDENQTSLETLEEVKEFMVSTKAFSTLRQDFLEWLETGKRHGDKNMTKTTEPVLDNREDPEISHPISTRGLILIDPIRKVLLF
ncbi:uncharacterized protein N7506_001050 [Penicillium brevicompactum]|uniref:uncharacterized protein n=1 Tax=Penicillium brevicompactum TaxID=5074 RepID=UPI0025407B2C|nr:uncharacterized protein N7506_001050 [Penicillium brevicompactum]KAJ5347797.1 hypothetical protein N7506_001050 [Penicillium brevicompactum]